MNLNQTFSDVSKYAPLASAIAACVALLVSFLSYSISRRAFKLAEQQEERRRPVLVPYLVDGYVKFFSNEKYRAYAFLVSLSNPSDTANGIANIDLHLTYTTPKSFQMTVKLRLDASLASSFPSTPVLPCPVKVEEHGTASGWTFFRVEEGILEGSAIDGHSIVFTDSQGTSVNLYPTMVREFADEVPKKV